MTRTTRIGGLILLLAIMALAALAIALSYNAAPAPAPVLADHVTRIKAIVYRQYGAPEVLQVEDVAKPAPAADELLIRVHAASINPLEWHFMRGTPYVMRLQVGIGRPKRTRLGIDFSGTVAAIGNDVRHFKVGDELFGSADGALAEFVTSNETGLASKPAAISFQQAAVVPIAGLTALQGLRDRGQVRPGQKVLINGASGGVGTFAVQIAKWLGAEVTGVCSTSNLSLVRSLGADHVIDYTREDYTRAAHYDLVFDVVGSRTLSDNLRSLTPHGTLVIVGAPNEGSWLGPMARFIQGWAIAPFVSQRIVLLQADLNRTEDLNVLRDMMQSGRLVPVIDRQYSLDETAAAMRYLEQGHARGKVVINVE